jgi:hypothetical protein
VLVPRYEALLWVLLQRESLFPSCILSTAAMLAGQMLAIHKVSFACSFSSLGSIGD